MAVLQYIVLIASSSPPHACMHVIKHVVGLNDHGSVSIDSCLCVLRGAPSDGVEKGGVV